MWVRCIRANIRLAKTQPSTGGTYESWISQREINLKWPSHCSILEGWQSETKWARRQWMRLEGVCVCVGWGGGCQCWALHKQTQSLWQPSPQLLLAGQWKKRLKSKTKLLLAFFSADNEFVPSHREIRVASQKPWNGIYIQAVKGKRTKGILERRALNCGAI